MTTPRISFDLNPFFKAEKLSLDLPKYFNTTPEMLGRSSHRPRLETLKSNLDLDVSGQHKPSKAYKQLSQRIAREKQLAVVEQKMKVRRALNQAKHKSVALVKEETAHSAPVLKWRTERKR